MLLKRNFFQSRQSGDIHGFILPGTFHESKLGFIAKQIAATFVKPSTMENITTGHWIFAGIFVIAFAVGIAIAYRKDLARIKPHYKRIWLLFIAMILIYFLIFGLNRIT
jgi:hypothetical protein